MAVMSDILWFFGLLFKIIFIGLGKVFLKFWKGVRALVGVIF